MSKLEEYLDRNESLTYWNRGRSMLPLIREGKDLVTVEKKGDGQRFKRFDVVLYRKNGKLILHRIIKVRKADYVIMGDNTYRPETGISDDIILGKMTVFERNGMRRTVRDPIYLVYVYLWWFFFPIRWIANVFANCSRRILKKVF